MQIEEMAKRLEEIERELAALRAEVRALQLRETHADYAIEIATTRTVGEPTDRAVILQEMLRSGLLSVPSAGELALAEEWAQLSNEERHAHIDAMHRLQLTPSLSEIVLQNRR